MWESRIKKVKTKKVEIKELMRDKCVWIPLRISNIKSLLFPLKQHLLIAIANMLFCKYVLYLLKFFVL